MSDKSSEPFGDEKCAGCQKWKLFLFFGFGAFSTILRPSLLAVINTGGIETSADDRVAESEVLHTTTTNNDDGVLLKLVTNTRNIGGDLHAVGEAHTRDLTNGGVRLAGSHCCHFRTHTTLERGIVENRTILNRIETTAHCHRFRLAAHLFAAMFNELIDSWHIEKNTPYLHETEVWAILLHGHKKCKGP